MMVKSGTRSTAVFVVLLSSLFLSIQAGCYRFVYKPRDKRTVRSQFHLPRNVKILSFESSPKEAGFFGREGLSISAVYQLEEDLFEEYLQEIKDHSRWKPRSFKSYSPSWAQSYSDSAFAWLDLPLTAWPERRLAHWPHKETVLSIERGLYYYSVIVGEQGQRIEHTGGGIHYERTYRGIHGSEIPEGASAVITTFGVLDLETRRLYAFIGFSG